MEHQRPEATVHTPRSARAAGATLALGLLMSCGGSGEPPAAPAVAPPRTELAEVDGGPAPAAPPVSPPATTPPPTTPPPATALSADFAIARVDWLDPVVREASDPAFRLVADRDIGFRVFLTSTEEGASAPPVRLRVRDAAGTLLHEERRVHDQLLGRDVALGSLTQALRFSLQGAWIRPGLRVELQIEDDARGPDALASNNGWLLFPPVDAARVLYVTLVPVETPDGGVARLPHEDEPSDAQRLATRAVVKAVLMASYPFSDVKVRIAGVERHTPDADSEKGPWTQLLGHISGLRADMKPAQATPGYFIAFKNWTSGVTKGISNTPGFSSVVQAPAPTPRATNWMGTVRHELGHSFNHVHPANGCHFIDPAGAQWGYDAMADRMIDPRLTRELMGSGCSADKPGWWSHAAYAAVEARIRLIGLEKPMDPADWK